LRTDIHLLLYFTHPVSYGGKGYTKFCFANLKKIAVCVTSKNETTMFVTGSSFNDLKEVLLESLKYSD